MKFFRSVLHRWQAAATNQRKTEAQSWVEEPMIRLLLGEASTPSHVPLEEEWNEGITRIGKELKFIGKITQREGLLAILGEVEGAVTQLNTNKGALFIGPGGSLKGIVKCGAVQIHGVMDATMDATKVVIKKTAKTRGSIRYSELEISKGGDNKVGLQHRAET